MSKKIINLGEKYWANTVIGNIIANDFDFKKEVRRTIIKKEPLCPCNKYGTMIMFEYEGELYTFNYLTGYPCQCEQ